MKDMKIMKGETKVSNDKRFTMVNSPECPLRVDQDHEA